MDLFKFNIFSKSFNYHIYLNKSISIEEEEEYNMDIARSQLITFYQLLTQLYRLAS